MKNKGKKKSQKKIKALKITMDFKLSKTKDTEVEIVFTVPYEELSIYLQEVLKDIQRDFDWPGFRKGQVPLEIIKKNISEKFLLEEGAKKCCRECYFKTLTENNIKAIGEPYLEITKLALNNPFEFKVRTEIIPNIQLPDYKSIASSFTKENISVSEKEIEDSVKWLLKSRAKLSLKQQDSKAQKGDFVEVVLKDLASGETNKDAFILGEGKLVGNIEENIVGMVQGETSNVEVEFPKNHFRKDLAGKKVAFEIKLDKLFSVEIPQLTDEFAQSIGAFKSAEELKSSIKEGIAKEKEADSIRKLKEEIVNKILEKSKFPIPEKLLEKEKQRIKTDFTNRLSQNNMSFDEYLAKFGKTKESLEKEIEKGAIVNIKKYLVLSEIIERENIKATEEEINNKVQSILSAYKSVEDAKKNFSEQELISFARDSILQEKALNFLASLANSLEGR